MLNDAGDTANSTPLVLQRNGNVLLNYRTEIRGINNTTTQLMLTGSTHPALLFNNSSEPVDVRKARILYYQQKIQFDFINDAENTFTAAGLTIARGGAVEASGSVTAATGFITTEPEGLRINGYPHARIHVKNTNQPAGSQNFAIINYAGTLSILPTPDDAGTTPIGGSWNYALSINRVGQVQIGGGGLFVEKISQAGGGGLTYNSYSPQVWGQANVNYAALTGVFLWSRIGLWITVEKRVDIGAVGAGNASYIVSVPQGSLINAYGYSWGTASGLGISGLNLDFFDPSFIKITFYAPSAGTFSLITRFSYLIAT